MKKFHFLQLWASLLPLHHLLQRYHRRPPATSLRRSVAKAFHKRSSGQDRSNYLALHADAPAVDNSQSLKTQPARLFQVFFDDRRNIPRRNAVQVEYIGDGNANRLFLLLHCC